MKNGSALTTKPPARCRTSVAKAALISSLELALRTSTCTPSVDAACRVSSICGFAFELLGFTSNATEETLGTTSRRNSSRFDPSAIDRKLIPVIFAPGRLRGPQDRIRQD